MKQSAGARLEKRILNVVAEGPISKSGLADRFPRARRLTAHLDALVWIGYLSMDLEDVYKLGPYVWPKGP